MTLTNITKIFQRPYIFVTHSFFLRIEKGYLSKTETHSRNEDCRIHTGYRPLATRHARYLPSLTLPSNIREMPCYHKIEETLAHGYTVVAPPAESKLYDMPSDLQMRTGPVVSLTIYRINSMGTVHHLVRGVPRARQRRR